MQYHRFVQHNLNEYVKGNSYAPMQYHRFVQPQTHGFSEWKQLPHYKAA